MGASALAASCRLQADRCRQRPSGSALPNRDSWCQCDLDPSSRCRHRSQGVGWLTRRSDHMIDRPSQTTVRSPAALDLDPILDFMRLLWSVEHGLQSTSKRMEASLGITGPQRLVLRIVSQRPGLSPGEVARIVHLHPSTITGILQRLVKKGLLRRERDSNDHRRIRLRSQAAAREFVAASTGTVESAVTRALTRIPMHSCAPRPGSAFGDCPCARRQSNRAARIGLMEERADGDDRGRCRRFKDQPAGALRYLSSTGTPTRLCSHRETADASNAGGRSSPDFGC